MNTSILRKSLLVLFWAALIVVSIHFYMENAVAYFFGYRNERFGETLLSNQLFFVLHMAGGTCALFLGPIQFWSWFRNGYLKIHRILGKVYIIGSLVAGVSALRLSVLNGCQACRYSLLVLSILYLFFTAAAYYSIRGYEIEAHRQFMIRSYVCALAFVLVRLPVGWMFGLVEASAERGIVIEWFFSLVPLFVVEFWLTWLPALKRSQAAQRVQ